MGYESVFGSLAWGLNRWMARDTLKLEQAGVEDIEDEQIKQAFYVAFALIFDLTRKISYMHLATRRYALLADPQLREIIVAEQEALLEIRGEGDDDIPWKELAELGDQINSDRCPRVEPAYDHLLDAWREFLRAFPDDG